MFMNKPLQQFKYIKGDVLIGFLMDRFGYTLKACKMEKGAGGLKVGDIMVRISSRNSKY